MIVGIAITILCLIALGAIGIHAILWNWDNNPYDCELEPWELGEGELIKEEGTTDAN